MKTRESRRSKFLKEMLDAFDSEDPSKLMNLANDYQVDFWPVQWVVDGNQELSERDYAILAEMGKELKVLVGRMHSSARVSAVPEDQWHKLEVAIHSYTQRLSPEAVRVLPSIVDLFQMGKLETLDSRYAEEVVSKLGKIVTRVGQLDALPPLTAPNASVRKAFEEAHRCYLYGFQTACAALCRTMVDSALREVLRANGYKGALGEFREVLQLPEAKTVLGDFHCMADRIRRVGNDAVHNVSRFESEYPPHTFQELLLVARRIIEHLYAVPKA